MGAGIMLAPVVEKHLPDLRRYGHAVTGSRHAGDRIVLAVLSAIAADRQVLDRALPVRFGLFRLFHRVWVAQTPVASYPAHGADDRLGADILGLEPVCRAAVLLALQEAFGIPDIALVLDRPEAEVAASVAQGRAVLRAAVACDSLVS